MASAAPSGRLDGHPLAERIRRTRRDCSAKRDLSARARTRGGGDALHGLRYLAARANPDSLGQRGTETPPSAKDSLGRRVLVPRLLGAELRLGSRRAADP